jgi:HNH endonuclease/NUMOD4 motif
MTENWLPIVKFEGLYSISDQGRTRSEERIVQLRNGRSRTVATKILSTTRPTNHEKYPTVTLWRNNIPIRRRIHDVVTEAFIGPRPSGLETLHWDDNPLNNKLTNLRYGTHAENKADQIRNSPTCRAGHPWTKENTYIRKDTHTRQCRSCQQIRFGRPPTIEAIEIVA